MTWLQTHTGGKFDLLDPSASPMRLQDIAWALSHTNRFGGHAGHYTVAQHSVLVALHVPEKLRAHALLHDAHEAYVGDVIRPVREALKARGDHAFERLCQELQILIEFHFGLRYLTEGERQIITHADLAALATERRDLMGGQLDWGPLPDPWPETIVPWATDEVHRKYLGALFDLRAAPCVWGLEVAP